MKFSWAAALSGALVWAATSTGFAATSGALTLTTYNIHSAVPDGYNASEHWPRVADLSNVADVLTTAGADIIALQEVRNLWAAPRHAEGDRYPLNHSLYLSSLLDMDYAYAGTLQVAPERKKAGGSRIQESRDYLEWGNWQQWTNNGEPHASYGNAILTKFPMKTPPERLKLPVGTDEVAKKKGDEPRVALRCELQDPLPGFGRVIIYCTHFQHNNADTRQRQIEALLERASQDLKPADDGSTVTVFLMGDLNHSPQPKEDRLLGAVKAAGFHDLAAEFAEKTGTKPDNTYPTKDANIRIDYIFCSRPVNVDAVSVVETPVSDHRPVTVKVTAKD